MEAVPGVDTSVAHIAQVQNYLRGGTDNFPADRAAAEQARVSVLHMVCDGDGPHAIVAGLLDAAPAGSFLALTHVGADLEPAATAEMARRINQRVARRIGRITGGPRHIRRPT